MGCGGEETFFFEATGVPEVSVPGLGVVSELAAIFFFPRKGDPDTGPNAASSLPEPFVDEEGILGVFTGSNGELFRLLDEEKNLSGFSAAADTADEAEDEEEVAASNLARPLATAPK